MIDRKNILIVWLYDREDLIKHFQELHSHYSITYLNRRSFYDDNNISLPGNSSVVYWDDYKNAQQLIDAVNPSVIIFMSLVSTYTIALNIAAGKRKIPTIIMQHGISEPLDTIHQAILEKKNSEAGYDEQMNKASLLFFFNTVIRYNPGLLFKQFRFLMLKRNKTAAFALQHGFYYGLKPAFTLVFNRYLGRHIINNYHAASNEIVELGNSSSEQIGDETGEGTFDINYKYLLFVDQPIPELTLANGDRIDLSSFYTKLGAVLNQAGIELLIKAHPKTLKDKILKEESGYKIWNGKLNVKLIKQAEAISGFYSSLLVPALEHKRGVIFKIRELVFYDDLSDLVQIVDLTRSDKWDVEFIRNLEHKKISFDKELFLNRFTLRNNSNSVSENLLCILKQIVG